MAQNNRKKLFINLIVLAGISLLIAGLSKSRSINLFTFFYTFVIPTGTFLCLAIMARRKDITGGYLYSTGAISGSMIGALYAIGIPYGILMISILTYSGGGANIGIGLLVLAMPVYLLIAIRRGWSNGLNKHIDSLINPMDVTALIMVYLAMSEREVASDAQNEIETKFREVFNLNEKESSNLFNYALTLLKQDTYPINNMGQLLKPSIETYTEDQSLSALELITHIANFDNPASASQKEIIESFKSEFRKKFLSSSKWV
jgi:hypothetical protein